MSFIDPKFWNNKKVYITGHTGFKGGWISLWLQSLGVTLKGFSQKPLERPNLYDSANVSEGMESNYGDIRQYDDLFGSVIDFDPEIIIHMAAQPLVRESYEKPLETFSTNLMGTANLLEISRSCPNLKSLLIITTDKCYENKEWSRGYKESDELGGHDPYSSSKACCELLVNSYRKSFFESDNSLAVASARAGNVIGGGDWSKDRLVPDVVKSFAEKKSVVIRNPKSIRPWQHVLEPLSGYLRLIQLLYQNPVNYSGAWNFGPSNDDCKSVEWIVNKIQKKWGPDTNWNIDDSINPHEAKLLKLDCSKARSLLQWQPKLHLSEALDLTIDWYKKWYQRGDIRDYCLYQIEKYSLYTN